MTRFCFLLLLGWLIAAPLSGQPSDPIVDPAVDDGMPRKLHETFILPRLSSPEATWTSFQRVMDQYSQIIIGSGYTNHNYELLRRMEDRMQQFFDLREVPPSVRRTTACEAAVYLYESFCRFRPMPPGTLPGREEAFAEMKDGYPGVWLVDDGVISIVYIDSGEYKGSFQFSARTVKMAEPVYEGVKSLSYVNEHANGLHDAYFLTPGPLIPSSWVRDMPSWLHATYFKQGVWQWIAILVVFFGLVFVLALLGRVVGRLTAQMPRGLRACVRLVMPLATIGLTVFAVWFLAVQIFVTGEVLQAIRFLEWFVVLISAVCIVFIIGSIISEIIISTRSLESKGIDSSLVRFSVKVASIVVAAAVAIEGATMLGFSITTVLAGAGVTGLAIALAAQESLRNVFGSVMLLLDKPFKVGQRVIVRGHDGVIESIGLRSTKMRQLDGHLTTFPNEDVAKADIENIGERQHIRRLLRLNISLTTPAEKIDEAIAIIQDILAVKEGDEESEKRNGPINHPDFPPRVFFESVGDYAYQILVLYWYHPADYWAYMEFSQVFNRAVVERFAKAGIQLAVPTQRSYLIPHDEGAAKALQDLAVLPGQKSGSGRPSADPEHGLEESET